MSDQASGFILDPSTLGNKILEWKRQGFHVLSPAIQVSSFSPGLGINPSLVLLDPTIDDKGRGLDVYRDDRTMAADERGLSKIALGKIAAAAGVSWIPNQSGRKDPLTIQNLWIYQMLGVYLAYDGTPQTIHGEKEIDYRDGSAGIGEWSRDRWEAELRQNRDLKQINGWSANRVLQARTHGAERAETGAMERAIRMGFGVKHVYTVKELALPFVTLRVCPVFDNADPATRAIIAAEQLRGAAALYAGASSRPALPPHTATDYIDVGALRTPQREPVPAQQPAAAPPQQPQRAQAPQPEPARQPPPPAAEQPRSREPGEDDGAPIEPPELPEGATIIQDCRKEEKPYSKQHQKHGQTFSKWTVTDGAGEVLVTVFPKWGEMVEKAFRDRSPVVIKAGPENKFHEREILNVERLGAGGGGASRESEPALPMEPATMKL